MEKEGDVKARLLGSAEDAFAAFERLLTAIPLDRRSGGWSVREVIGHLASWTEAAARGILEDIAGFPWHDEERDAFNGRARRQVSVESDAQLVQRYSAARTTFLATLMAAPPAALAPGAAAGEWARGIVEHYMGHIARLEGRTAA
ncbi:MAG TPA: DinB family protein [Candidatus Dormibacteraeota bacterium]